MLAAPRPFTWSSTASSAVSWISNVRCAYSENEAAVRSALALASAATLRQLHHANSVKISSGTKNCDRNRRKSPARAGDDNWPWISTAAQIAIKAATVGSATELKGRIEKISMPRRWLRSAVAPMTPAPAARKRTASLSREIGSKAAAVPANSTASAVAGDMRKSPDVEPGAAAGASQDSSRKSKPPNCWMRLDAPRRAAITPKANRQRGPSGSCGRMADAINRVANAVTGFMVARPPQFVTRGRPANQPTSVMRPTSAAPADAALATSRSTPKGAWCASSPD